jgi:hypothetical protein
MRIKKYLNDSVIILIILLMEGLTAWIPVGAQGDIIKGAKSKQLGLHTVFTCSEAGGIAVDRGL